MKTILYTLIILSATLSSCSKKYACKCTTTLGRPGYYPKETETVEDIGKFTTKKKATQICDNTATQMQSNTRLLFPDYINVSTKCELKDY